MSYNIETTAVFDRVFKSLDRYTQKIISGWIRKNLESSENPFLIGQNMTPDISGQWRYRIGDCRLLCRTDGNRLVILTLTLGTVLPEYYKR